MTGQSSPPDRRLLARHLEEQLIEGSPAGTRLPSERDLAIQFGVSRPVVREALRGLAERGLLDVVPGRGTFTREFGGVDAVGPLDTLLRREATPRHLVEARLMLECETASLAAGRAQPAELRAMAAALEHFDSASGPLEKARFDIAFHTLVARAAHNPAIEVMFLAVTAPTYELMVRSLADPTVHQEGAALHSQILAAIRHGDAAAARSAMAEHVGLALRRYGPDLDEKVDVLAQREISRMLGPGASLAGILATIRLFDDDQIEPGGAGPADRIGAPAP